MHPESAEPAPSEPSPPPRGKAPTLDHRRIRFRDAAPILVIHAICLGVLWTGWSWTALVVAGALYWLRMFAITAFYHRYFSHRTFRTHPAVRFAFALIGTSSAQRGPLWWAAHHREHHRHADEEPDPHSPWWRGVLWSHTLWFLTEKGRATDWRTIPDWKSSPELRWLERYHLVGPVGLIALLAALGAALAEWAPGLGTGPGQLVVWGFGISTTVLYHATLTINSLAHPVGTRRFNTPDDSRNNWLLALITLGEGWHNNHHYHPGTVRQGFYWWEFDPAYWILRTMSWIGLVWDLRPVPASVYERAEADRARNAA
ncbi:MAG: acyl-CoA desaturase [Phycisphaerales bacterium]|nr:acyl-CoA desaturase [Phycisphaerales bacterium]